METTINLNDWEVKEYETMLGTLRESGLMVVGTDHSGTLMQKVLSW